MAGPSRLKLTISGIDKADSRLDHIVNSALNGTPLYMADWKVSALRVVGLHDGEEPGLEIDLEPVTP